MLYVLGKLQNLFRGLWIVPRAATPKRLYRTRADVSPFTAEPKRASGKALTFIRTDGT